MLVWFLKLIKGAILLLRCEMQQQIPFDFTGHIRCCVATKQLLHGDKAIAASPCSNQLGLKSLKG